MRNRFVPALLVTAERISAALGRPANREPSR
jgi:hypothetical protein